MDEPIDFGSMTLGEALAHHGVKGMKWGVRRDPKTGIRPIALTLDRSKFGTASKKNADRYNTSREVKGDIKKTKKLNTSSRKGVVAARAEHKDAIQKKLAENPAYAKAYKRQTSAGRAAAKKALKLYGAYTVLSLATGNGVPGFSGAAHARRGADYIKSNPSMMNAKLKDSVYKVTTL